MSSSIPTSWEDAAGNDADVAPAPAPSAAAAAAPAAANAAPAAAAAAAAANNDHLEANEREMGLRKTEIRERAQQSLAKRQTNLKKAIESYNDARALYDENVRSLTVMEQELAAIGAVPKQIPKKLDLSKKIQKLKTQRNMHEKTMKSKYEAVKRTRRRVKRGQKTINNTRSNTLASLIGLSPPINNVKTENFNTNSIIYKAEIACGPDDSDYRSRQCTSENYHNWITLYNKNKECLARRMRDQIARGRPADPGHMKAMKYAFSAAKGCYQLIKRYQGKNNVSLKRHLPQRSSAKTSRNFKNAVETKRQRYPSVFLSEFTSAHVPGFSHPAQYEEIGKKIETELRRENDEEND